MLELLLKNVIVLRGQQLNHESGSTLKVRLNSIFFFIVEFTLERDVTSLDDTHFDHLYHT